MILSKTIDEVVNGEDVQTELEVEFEVTPLTPAKTYGPPEFCHPAEGGYAEISEIWEVVAFVHPNKAVSMRRVKTREDLFDIEEFMEYLEDECYQMYCSENEVDDYLED